MKNTLLLILLLPFLLSSCASPAPTSRFYHEHKGKEGVKNMKIPGWAIWVGSGLAHEIVKDEEVRSVLQLARKVKKLRFMSVEEGNNSIHPAEVASFVQRLRDHQYEDLIMVRDRESTVNIMVKDNTDKLKNLIVLVNDGSDFVYLDMKTSIKYKDLNRLVNSFLKDMKLGKEKKPKEKEPEKEKAPQV